MDKIRMWSPTLREVLPRSEDVGPLPKDQEAHLARILPVGCVQKLLPVREGGPAELEVDVGRLVVLVANGRVEVLHDNRAEPPADGPVVVGLVECMGTTLPRTVIRALEPCTCYVIPFLERRIRRDSPEAIPDEVFFERVCTEVEWLGRYIRQYYRSQMGRLASRITALEANLDDYFLPQNAGLVPGPYEAEKVEMRVFVVQDEPARLQALLPPGIRSTPGSDGRYLVACTRFADMRPTHTMAEARSFDYQETAFFLPCVGFPAFGVFCPALYPDSYLAIALGRELFGFPKRYGTTLVSDHGGGTADFGLNEGLVFSGRWKGLRAVDEGTLFQGLLSDLFQHLPGVDWLGAAVADYLETVKRGSYEAFWPQVPVYVRHQVPTTVLEGERDPTYQVDRLVRIPFGVQGIRSCYRLESPTLEFVDPSFPLAGRCLSAWRLNLSMQFSEGVVVRDYGRLRWSLEGRVRRARTRLERLRTFSRILVGMENPQIVGGEGPDLTELRILDEQRMVDQVGQEA